jgi:hypothetical protein
MRSPDQPERDNSLTPRAELAPRGMASFALLFRLALADLWHERILTLCVIVAITAVLAPLLILLSLKYGLVETLRYRLINDPRNREIRPQSPQIFTQADIEALRARPDVRFVMPQTRTISTLVKISLPGPKSDWFETEILPTAEGDPLLVENGTDAPSAGQCALSHSLHHRLAAGGDFGQIRVTVGRQGATGFETVHTDLTVSGIVGERATSRETLFVPLEFLEHVEHWLEGHPVPELGWPGSITGVSPLVDALIVPTTRPLEPAEQAALVINTGFSSYESLTPEQAKAELNPLPPDAEAFYRFTTDAGRNEAAADDATLTRFRAALPSVAGDLYGYCQPMEIELTFPDGRPLRSATFEVLREIVNRPAKRLEPSPKQNQRAPIPVQSPPENQPTIRRGMPVDTPKIAPSEQSKALPLPKPAPKVPQRAIPMPPAPPAANPIAPDGVIRLDQTVKPPPPPPPRPKPEPSEDGQPKRKSNPDDPNSEVPTKKRRSSGFQGSGLFSPYGGRYVLAAVAACPPAVTLPIVFLPDSWGIADGQTLQAIYSSPTGAVPFPATVRVHKDSSPYLAQSTAGVLRVANERAIEFSEPLGTFVTTRRGWPNFRLVAKDIDSVQGIVDHFHNLGMNVITKAERIRDVKELDRYTTQVFWLIAGVGLTGAVGALLASLFAAVERKRRSLGVLRLLGMRRRTLVRLPFYQSAIIVSASVGLAIAAWWWVSGFIARFTSSYLEAGESLATLPREHLLILLVGALCIAAFTSFLAGLRVMRVDPSEAIRDE